MIAQCALLPIAHKFIHVLIKILAFGVFSFVFQLCSRDCTIISSRGFNEKKNLSFSVVCLGRFMS